MQWDISKLTLEGGTFKVFSAILARACLSQVLTIISLGLTACGELAKEDVRFEL
jgi:hypothetical protein